MNYEMEDLIDYERHQYCGRCGLKLGVEVREGDPVNYNKVTGLPTYSYYKRCPSFNTYNHDFSYSHDVAFSYREEPNESV